jgi:hypothetical protein
MILGSIEQDIPVHELLHLAALGEGELELIEAHLQEGSPAIGRAPRDLQIPEQCSLVTVVRNGVPTPLRPDTVFQQGDKVIAIGKTECETLLHRQKRADSWGLVGRIAPCRLRINGRSGRPDTALGRIGCARCMSQVPLGACDGDTASAVGRAVSGAP